MPRPSDSRTRATIEIGFDDTVGLTAEFDHPWSASLDEPVAVFLVTSFMLRQLLNVGGSEADAVAENLRDAYTRWDLLDIAQRELIPTNPRRVTKRFVASVEVVGDGYPKFQLSPKGFGLGLIGRGINDYAMQSVYAARAYLADYYSGDLDSLTRLSEALSTLGEFYLGGEVRIRDQSDWALAVAHLACSSEHNLMSTLSDLEFQDAVISLGNALASLSSVDELTLDAEAERYIADATSPDYA